MGYVQHVANVEVHNSFSALDEDKGWTEVTKNKRQNKMKQVPRKHWKPINTREELFLGTVGEEYETVEVTADSGAVTTVGPKDACTAFP